MGQIEGDAEVSRVAVPTIPATGNRRRTNADPSLFDSEVVSQRLELAGAEQRASQVEERGQDVGAALIADRLGGSRTAACLCPTTERDLADGVGPASALAAAATTSRRPAGRGHRGRHGRPRLGTPAASPPAAWPTWSRSASTRSAWPAPARLRRSTSWCSAATAADVTSVITGGRQVVQDGRHLLAGDVPAALARANAARRGDRGHAGPGR
jgi:hypothetical protein